MSENTKLTKIEHQEIKEPCKPKERKTTLIHIPETEEYEIHRKATDTEPAKKVRFPKKYKEQMQMMPDEFENVQNAIEEYNRENREVEVYSDSIEASVGYQSLIRILSKFFGSRVAYYRSAEGGSLSLEEARKEVYRRNITDEQAMELLDDVLRMPSEHISFMHLLELNDNSPSAAQNIWEMMKRQAQDEFESGHRAAEAFEAVSYMNDAWNRASYLGLRESLCAEWQPKGGIELTMIDTIAQAWLQLQFWTQESVKRAQSEPRRENFEFVKWKEWNRQAYQKQWHAGDWDIPTISERDAVEHAAQMADRWQRMYFRAIRSLRDWRRYAPQVTINNPQQVNIATDGGQQINTTN